MRRLTTLLAATAMCAMTANAAFAQKWDMPMAYPASNFFSQLGADFAKCVATGTKGKLDIAIHAGGSLFAGDDIMRAVETGQAPIGERLISAQANQNPLYGIDSIPFLATSYAESEKLWKAAKAPMSKLLDSQNLIYIYAAPWPPQGLYTKRAVNSVADLKGVKFRAYNAATARIAELVGMVPVQIEAADLSQALSTGVADAFISSGATGVDSKVWESLKYFYNVQAWLPRNVVFANKDSWKALDDATRKVVSDCGDKASAEGLATSQKLSGGYLKTLASHGMTVSAPSAKLKEQLKGFGDTMTQEWLKNAGPDGRAIIAAYRGK